MPPHSIILRRTASIAKLPCCALAFAAASLAGAQNAPPTDQQTAIVTFYTHGTVKGGLLPGSKHGTFDGAIFDGRNVLVSFFHEEVLTHNNRFITLRLPLGPHDFVATTGDQPRHEDHIEVTLLPGHKYFFRAQNETGITGGQKARLDPMTCEEAHKEASGAKSFHPKHPSPELSAQFVSIEEMPPCQ